MSAAAYGGSAPPEAPASGSVSKWWRRGSRRYTARSFQRGSGVEPIPDGVREPAPFPPQGDVHIVVAAPAPPSAGGGVLRAAAESCHDHVRRLDRPRQPEALCAERR